MKKLIGIVVLGLLLSSISFAKHKTNKLNKFVIINLHYHGVYNIIFNRGGPSGNDYTLNWYYKIYENENKDFYNKLLKSKKRRIKEKKLFQYAEKYDVVLKKIIPLENLNVGLTDETLGNFKTINIPLFFYIVDFSHIREMNFRKKLYKFLEDNEIRTITTKEDIKKDLKAINIIWKQAGINFFIRENDITFIVPRLENLLENVIWLNENCNTSGACFNRPSKKSDYLKSKNKKQHDIYKETVQQKKNYKSGGLNIYYLPKMLGKNACGIASVPIERTWRNTFGGYVIMGDKCNNHNRAKTLAHEIGHLLNLKHINDKNNLMYKSIIGKDKLNETQIEIARKPFGKTKNINNVAEEDADN